MTTTIIGAPRFTSTLFSLRPDGFLRWQQDFPQNQFSTASPKVILTSEYGTNIFVYFRAYNDYVDDPLPAQLWIFNEDGHVLHREGLECPGHARKIGDVLVTDPDGWGVLHPDLDPRLNDKFGISTRGRGGAQNPPLSP